MPKIETKIQMRLEEFNALPLHDQSLEGLNIDFSVKEIRIKFGIFNDPINDYDYFEFLFTNVEQFSVSDFYMESLLVAEINSHKIKVIEGNRFNFQLIVLSGLSNPDIIINFSFSSCYKIPV